MNNLATLCHAAVVTAKLRDIPVWGLPIFPELIVIIIIVNQASSTPGGSGFRDLTYFIPRDEGQDGAQRASLDAFLS